MKLNYTILWFDDNDEYIASVDMEAIEDEIRSRGFDPNIITVNNETEFNYHAPYKDIDLIIIDYNLGEKHGSDFIESVRGHQIFTEIIFYSAQGNADLWKIVCEKKLEGIFVTHRSQIQDKLIKVSEHYINKVFDLENMRGIIMSEVGDIDLLLEDLFALAMGDLDGNQRGNIFKKFHKSAEKQHYDNSIKLKEFIDSPSINSLIELCDSKKRWDNYQRLKKHHDELKKIETPENYIDEVLRPRNFLAHGSPERKDDGSFVFTNHGKEYHLTQEESKKLRNNISVYKNFFLKVKEVLAERK